ncbi:hypothetical protein IFM89_007025 [Coptis chinensis]|uniref:Uncharacterized protein n=1 Tax=Coptis chinensis TaxID=261450 RepID=A0A835M515_9MAGN|nr:hypothetical protein IFM89_007025 [Coptis chinensis]
MVMKRYTWEGPIPATVAMIGVGGRDSRIGKVRIQLSTLESERVYTHAYPLLMLHPSSVKKMGELHLAIRFSCANMANVLHMYMSPLLPKMHYAQPLSVSQVESLRKGLGFNLVDEEMVASRWCTVGRQRVVLHRRVGIIVDLDFGLVVVVMVSGGSGSTKLVLVEGDDGGVECGAAQEVEYSWELGNDSSICMVLQNANEGKESNNDDRVKMLFD